MRAHGTTVTQQVTEQAKETGTTVLVGGAPAKSTVAQESAATTVQTSRVEEQSASQPTSATTAAASVFEGQAGRVIGSLVIIYLVSTFAGFPF